MRAYHRQRGHRPCRYWRPAQDTRILWVFTRATGLCVRLPKGHAPNGRLIPGAPDFSVPTRDRLWSTVRHLHDLRALWPHETLLRRTRPRRVPTLPSGSAAGKQHPLVALTAPQNASVPPRLVTVLTRAVVSLVFVKPRGSCGWSTRHVPSLPTRCIAAQAHAARYDPIVLPRTRRRPGRWAPRRRGRVLRSRVATGSERLSWRRPSRAAPALNDR